MFFSKSLIPLNLLSFSFFMHAAFGVEVNYIGHNFFGQLKYPVNGTFEVNLFKILVDLCSLA